MTIPDPVLTTSLPWLDALPDPGLLVDLTGGQVRYANPAAARHFGLDLPSMTGRFLQDLWPGLAAQLATPEPLPRTLRLRATGLWAWVDVRAFEVGDLVAVQLSDATAQRAAEVRGGALFELAGALSRALSAEEAAGVVLGQGLAALGAATGSVFVLETAREDLILAGSVGYDEAYMGGWRRFPLSAPTLLGDAVRAGEPLFLATAEVDARYPHLRVQRTAPTRSVAALPLLFGGRAVGVMNFGFSTDHAFDQAERRFLLALAEGLAQALERARLFEAQERARERAILLADAGELLTATPDPQGVLDALAHLVVPTVADWCTVALPDRRGLLTLRVTAHPDPGKVEVLRRFRERVPIGVDDDHPLARVFRTGEVFLVPELEDVVSMMPGDTREEGFAATTVAVGARSLLAVPLIARGEVLGVLSLVSQTPGHFSAEDLPFVQDLVRRAALALDNARLTAERELAWQGVRAERALLAAVLENAPAVGYLKDTGGRYRYVNAAFEALFEVRREDVLGRTDVELFGEAVGGPLRENDLLILSGGARDFEETADTPRGRVVYRSVKFPLPGEDGTAQGIGGLSLDITGQRAAQDALAASQARYQALIEVTNQYVWTNSPQGEMVGEQPGWARLTGQSPEEYGGYGWSERLHPDDREGAVEAWREAVDTRSLYQVEQRVQVRDGTYRSFLVRAVPLLNEDGTLREWVGLHSDITDLKRAELMLKAWGSELERQVAAQTRELRAANEELGAFAYTVSHDLRAPVRHVGSFAGLLRKKIGDDPGLLRYVDQIEGAATRMETLTDALLGLARAGAAQLNTADVNLGPLVRAAISDLTPELRGRNVTWRVGTLPTVRADVACFARCSPTCWAMP